MKRNRILEIVELELSKRHEVEYWGSLENVQNETDIFEYVIDENIVDQDWFDERCRYGTDELIEELKPLI